MCRTFTAKHFHLGSEVLILNDSDIFHTDVFKRCDDFSAIMASSAEFA